jgi:Flp pilus assembly pilin Flp
VRSGSPLTTPWVSVRGQSADKAALLRIVIERIQQKHSNMISELQTIKRLITDDDGLTTTEYALTLLLFAVAIMFVGELATAAQSLPVD